MPTPSQRTGLPNLGAAVPFLLVLSGLLCACSTGAGEDAPGRTNAPPQTEYIVLGMGCFWGAEKRMSAIPGVMDVVSGYAGGSFANPTYRDVLRAKYDGRVRNHAEVVKVVFDPAVTSAERVLIGFWQNHDPTQGDRQGNDFGNNYRSAVYYLGESQREAALHTRDRYQPALTAAGHGPITTEITALDAFYPAEDYHQDYLVKNPKGYCGLGGTGVVYPHEDRAE